MLVIYVEAIIYLLLYNYIYIILFIIIYYYITIPLNNIVAILQIKLLLLGWRMH